MIVEDKIFS